MKQNFSNDNILEDVKDSSNKNKREGVEVTSTLGSERVTKKLGALNKVINHDEGILSQDIDELEHALQDKDTRVRIGELEISVGDMEGLGRECPEFLEGVKQNIVKGEDKFTFMTPDIARYIAKHGKELRFENLTELSEEIAEILSRNEDLRSFMSFYLTSISDKTAEYLGRYKGVYLSLNNIKKLTDRAIESLSAKEGFSLGLNDLTELSDKGAELLSKCKVKSLDLDGLTELSDKVAEYLGSFQGEYLELNGLTHLSDSVAQHLSKSKTYLNLRGIKTISDSVAAHLSNFKGKRLGLHSLTALSEKSAEYLSKVESYIDLDNVTEISDQGCRFLAQKKGGIDFQSSPDTKRRVQRYGGKV